MRLMDSFSQPERFVWRDGAFTVIVPNGTRTAYHPRASLSRLRALLVPQIRLTRAGNISLYQPAPPEPQPYDFYLAQLIHYGLDFYFDIEAAQRALEIAIRMGRLHVPAGLVKLEKELKKAYERKREKAHKDAMRYAAKQKSGDTAGAVIPVGTSEGESESQPTQGSAPPKPARRRKRKVIIRTSDDSEVRSSNKQSLSKPDGESGEDNDAIAVALDFQHSTSSDRSSAASSEKIHEVTTSGSISSGHSSINTESSEEAEDEEYSSDNDPFLDRQDFKRIKLDRANKKDDFVLRSTPEPAPSVVRKQLPPAEFKTRRIASKPQVDIQSVNSAAEETLYNQSATPTFASPGKIPARKPFVDPAKRPSWTIPVRSPSSTQNDTPKSVSFSQVQRETPTKVPAAEKGTFSSAMKTSQGSPHIRTPSPSSDHSYMTPLRSILKKTTAHRTSSQKTSQGRRPETLGQLPHDHHATSFRRRKRKRNRQADPYLYSGLDGARDPYDSPNVPPVVEKPYITSDIVDGKPISSLKKSTSHQGLAASSHHNTAPLMSTGQQQQQANKMGNQDRIVAKIIRSTSAGDVRHSDGEHNKHTTLKPAPSSQSQYDTPPQGALILKRGGKSVVKNRKNSFRIGIGNGQHMAWGSQSRGNLVRAGGVY